MIRTDLQELLLANLRDVKDFPKPGIVFKDITPLLSNPDCLSAVVEAMLADIVDFDPEIIVGIESRGFIIGAILASRLGVPFVPLRKSGKLPFTTFKESYGLEYGTDSLEIHTDAIPKGARVLIHDDVLATGGTALAASKLCERAGAGELAYAFLMELSFLPGREKLASYSNKIISTLNIS